MNEKIQKKAPDAKTVLHGNTAKIDPKKDITGLYTTNTVTMKKESGRGNTPVIGDENASHARHFGEDNKK